MCLMTSDVLVSNASNFKEVLGFSPCSLSHRCISQQLKDPQKAVKKQELPDSHICVAESHGHIVLAALRARECRHWPPSKEPEWVASSPHPPGSGTRGGSRAGALCRLGGGDCWAGDACPTVLLAPLGSPCLVGISLSPCPALTGRLEFTVWHGRCGAEPSPAILF